MIATVIDKRDAAVRARIVGLWRERAEEGGRRPTHVELSGLLGISRWAVGRVVADLTFSGELPELLEEKVRECGSITASGRDDHARRAAQIRLEWERAARSRPRKVRRGLPTIREEIRELRMIERRLGIGRAS